jgi:TP901 family phage tail tape measure protein
MTTKIGSLFGDVSLRTSQLDKDIAGVGKKLGKMGKSMKSAGKQTTTKLTAPLLAIGAAALVSFGNFEKGMNEVRSLMPDLNQGEFVQLETDVRNLSVEMGVNAVDAVGALYQAISAGVPKDNVISFLSIATKTGIAGLSDTTTAVDTLTSVLNAYKRPAEDAEAVADALFTTVRLGKTNFEEIGASISSVAPLAAAMNVPLEEVTGALATLTKSGVPTAQAITQIRASLISLQKPTAGMRDAISNLGFADGQQLLDSRGYLGALQALRTESGLSAAALVEAFGRVEGYMALLGQTGGNFAGAIADLQAMTEASGAMTAAFEINNAGLNRSIAKSLAIFNEFALLIGPQLGPIIEDISAKFKAWYTANKESIPGWIELGIKIAAVAAVVGPVLLVLGQLLIVFSNVWAVVAALSVGLGVLFDKMGFLREAGAALGQMLVDLFSMDFAGMIGSLLGLLGEIIEMFTGIQFSAERVRSDVVRVFSAIGRAIDSVFNKLKRAWELFSKFSGATSAGNAIGGMISKIAFRAEGGPVSSGSPYIVGEQGPELFVPRYSGTIIPNGAGGGGSGQTVNMTFNGVGMEMKAWLKNHSGEIAKIAVGAVKENNLRTV